MDISNIIVLGVNATMGRLEPELGFDASADKNEHEFFQSFMPDWPLFPFSGRKIDVQAIDALVKAVGSHSERRRIMRAIAQYTEALRAWRLGNEIPCLAHLYMGVEAISKAVSREYLKRIGKTEDELAVHWGISKRTLENEYRRRLVFQGDNDTFDTARKVRDTFVHSLADFGDIHKPAQEVIIKTSAYLRQSIINLMDLTETDRSQLLCDDYNIARGPITLLRFLRGELIGMPDQLAAEDQSYPILTWTSKLKRVAVGANGKYGFQTEENVTPKLGAGVQFRPQRYEVWDGSVFEQQSGPSIEPMNTTVTSAKSKHRLRYRAASRIRTGLLWLAAKFDPP